MLWKEGEPEILQCTRSPIKLTSACWSPSRPGVCTVVATKTTARKYSPRTL